MREILFRGKDDESGKFVYGYFCLERDMRWESPFCLKPSITWEENGVMRHSFVISETVGQYTGLIDKNGTKIFEGDIITREYDKYWGNRKVERKKQIGFVIFKEGQYESVNTKKEIVHFLGNQKLIVRKDDYTTIIGNIYDNPELLEVKNE